MNDNLPVITIDGPSGSGKGTISRLVARETGFSLLDSGALYRLAALAAKKQALDFENEQQVAEKAGSLDIVFQVVGDNTQVILNGENVTSAIREEEIGMYASKVAAYPMVRAALLERQRAFLQPPGLVADGRDMGTVVFPRATLKIFLTASAQERARRRLEQLRAAGQELGDEAYGKILADIEERDLKDMNRAVSPLVPAPDAVVLDSTRLSIDQVFNEVISRFRGRVSQGAS